MYNNFLQVISDCYSLLGWCQLSFESRVGFPLRQEPENVGEAVPHPQRCLRCSLLHSHGSRIRIRRKHQSVSYEYETAPNNLKEKLLKGISPV